MFGVLFLNEINRLGISFLGEYIHKMFDETRKQLKFIDAPVEQQKINKRMTNHIERITINPAVCHGKPCVRGMRWPVEVVLDLLGSGMTIPEILIDHPELEQADITACLNYAKLLMSGQALAIAA